jgi:ATP-dependent DNA helicase RecG
MQPAIGKLVRFLNLEITKNFENRAVIGGLERIIPTWESEARAEKLGEDVIARVSSVLQDYPTLDHEGRVTAIKGLIATLRAGNESNHHGPSVMQPVVKDGIAAKNPPRTTEGSTKQRSSKRPVLENDNVGLNAPLTVLTGIGENRSRILKELGLHTLGDLLYYFPRRYDDYSKLKPINRINYGEELTIIAMVQSISSRKARGGSMTVTEAVISDGTGFLRLVWFNNHYIERQMRSGDQIVVSGKVDMYLGRFVINHPSWELLEKEHLHTNRIVPVYSLAANISQKTLRSVIYQTVMHWAPRIKDYLPDAIQNNVSLIRLGDALQQIHFPESEVFLNNARTRLAFDEIFLLQLGVMQQKKSWQTLSAQPFMVTNDQKNKYFDSLPFQMTDSQNTALDEISKDLASGHPMNRLLQGDVGSGKTVVAAFAAYAVSLSGAQSALMAPTSILADQHFKTLRKILAESNGLIPLDQIRLLIGDTPEEEKADIREGVKNGEIKVLIGTHALLEDPIVFKDLQFVAIDEQHRFGVEQRAILRNKGKNPHLLVMTATPIPRSLALTIYGDLDLSVLAEMPMGRKPIDTYILFPTEHERAYSLIEQQLDAGHQSFIIYPLVEDNSEENETKAAVNEFERLQHKVFPHRKLALIHGRMPQDEKDRVMQAFRDQELQILVATSVVEVGLDIPNATLILIEGANRFGLAQLHQLRGRVGRSDVKSYCLLIPETEDKVENERLMAMAQTNDGFRLADLDLQQRGPGEFLGDRQSGFTSLRMASITDVHMIEKAREQAELLFKIDPNLEKSEHAAIKQNMRYFWRTGIGDIS